MRRLDRGVSETSQVAVAEVIAENDDEIGLGVGRHGAQQQNEYGVEDAVHIRSPVCDGKLRVEN